MSENAQNLNQLLRDIEQELRDIDLWSNSAPAETALQSDQPFCHDTMPFQHWIQWVMIPTFDSILCKNGQLPEYSKISPMAELAFADANEKTERLLSLLQELDNLINRHTAA